LKGKRVSEIEGFCKECFDEAIRPKISQKAKAFVGECKLKGYRVVLVTGAIEPLAKHAKKYFGADDVIATKPKARGGKYTGEVIGLHPFRERKVKLVKDYVKRKKINLKQSLAAGDHHTDAVLLEIVGNPVAVDPDKGLREIAKQRKWKIISLK